MEVVVVNLKTGERKVVESYPSPEDVPMAAAAKILAKFILERESA